MRERVRVLVREFEHRRAPRPRHPEPARVGARARHHHLPHRPEHLHRLAHLELLHQRLQTLEREVVQRGGYPRAGEPLCRRAFLVRRARSPILPERREERLGVHVQVGASRRGRVGRRRARRRPPRQCALGAIQRRGVRLVPPGRRRVVLGEGADRGGAMTTRVVIGRTRGSSSRAGVSAARNARARVGRTSHRDTSRPNRRGADGRRRHDRSHARGDVPVFRAT